MAISNDPNDPAYILGPKFTQVAAPAPQAEGDTSWGCHHSILTPGCKVCGRGAAPAETAGPVLRFNHSTEWSKDLEVMRHQGPTRWTKEQLDALQKQLNAHGLSVVSDAIGSLRLDVADMQETTGDTSSEPWPELPEGERDLDVIWFRNHKPELHAFWFKFDAPLNTDIHWLRLAEAFGKKCVVQHAQHIKQFLNELYATMIDPCAEGQIKVADMTKALVDAARSNRQALYDAGARVANLELELDTLRRERKGEVWCWGDDGEDHPESLNCPVLMQPDVVRRLVVAESELRRLEPSTSESAYSVNLLAGGRRDGV